MTTKVCLRYFLRNIGVTIPALVRNTTRMGSSNKIPVAKVTEVIELI
jgi:hypothetical protein